MNSSLKYCSILNRLQRHSRITNINLHTSCRVLTNSNVDVHESKSTSPSVENQGKVKEPFIKNLFAGIFDKEMLVYPEYVSYEDYSSAENRVRPVTDFFLHVNDSRTIDEEGKIPELVLEFLKESNLFNPLIPKEFQGNFLAKKEYMRFFEAVGMDCSVANLLSYHSNVVNALLLYGNETQKQKYLPKLASGEWTIAFALNEKVSGFDLRDMSLTAKPMADDKWSLTGSKMWVANADKADFFLVFAKTWDHQVTELDSLKSTVFIVDKCSNGIQCSEPLEQMSSRGLSICNVTFEDTIVGDGDILGNIGDGHDIALASLSRGKLARAAAVCGRLRQLSNMVTEYAINTKASGVPLTRYELCRYNLGKIVSDIYSLESMIYLIAGNQDDFDEYDSTLEELATDIFSIETYLNVIDSCVNIIGAQAVLKSSPLERILRDSRSYLLHDLIPTDVKKIYIATNGLQQAGATSYDEIKKFRNPLDFPMFAIKKYFHYQNGFKDNPKLPGELRQMVHPSLGIEADKIEHCQIRLEFVVKEMMRRWGKELIDKQYELIQLSNCATSMLVMTAVLARASRSYCIGLQNADLERVICNSLCYLHHEQFMRTTDELIDGPVTSGRGSIFKIGEDVVNAKGYFFAHPITRNY